MDVRCNRCGTEYEFDDALISERGTTVKCTNCGLQFKVYPSHHSGGPERWADAPDGSNGDRSDSDKRPTLGKPMECNQRLPAPAALPLPPRPTGA